MQHDTKEAAMGRLKLILAWIWDQFIYPVVSAFKPSSKDKGQKQ
jgi:hypothetical protein